MAEIEEEGNFHGPSVQLWTHAAICSAGIATNAAAIITINRKFDVKKHTVFFLASGLMASGV